MNRMWRRDLLILIVCWMAAFIFTLETVRGTFGWEFRRGFLTFFGLGW